MLNYGLVLVVGVLGGLATTLGWTVVPISRRPSCIDSHHDKSCLTFDFSSSHAWEDFYRESDDGTVTEWHSSISFATIGSFCSNASSVLLVGCGDSRLPDYFLQQTPPPPHLTLLDSSATCIERLQRRYSQQPNVTCVCGDVLNATSVLSDQPAASDTILDKGLLDALLCNDGWDVAVTQWFDQAAQLLARSGGGGRYVMISYVLPQSTQAFLRALHDDWEWTFGVGADSSSSSRVMISTAVREGALPNETPPTNVEL